jgi:AcrR family transcriptional regulator
MTATARPLRSDAERNLRSIRAAALAVLSERGTEAGMEEIAQRAGVGVGTLYRRFANKDALLDELMRAIFDDIVSAADAALERTDATGLATFLAAVGGSLTDHQGCAQELLRAAATPEQSAALRTRIGALTERAHDTGEIAPHIAAGDVYTVMWGLRGVVEATAHVAPRAWERYLELQLAGLRAAEEPTHRRTLSRAQLAAVSSRRAQA